MADGFLNRWSQRKQDVRAGKPLAEPVVAPLPVASNPAPADTKANVVEAPPPAAPELPTLADAHQLTPASDFKPFMVQGVAADVKNAAMKKLFTDPHFNVMDGLDTYIDDYSISDPIPEAMLRKMVSAKFLNLFDDEEKSEVQPASDLPAALRDVPDTAAPETVAQSPLPLEAPKISDDLVNDHVDLRLQPDHAPEPTGLGRGAA
jgi:Protein of unknown function (DUF3306)